MPDIDYLYNAVSSLVTAKSRSELFDLAFKNISKVIDFDAVALLCFQDNRAQIIIKPRKMVSERYLSDVENNLKQGFLSLLGSEKKEIDFSVEIKESKRSVLQQPVQSEIKLPLLSGLSVVGMLHLSSESSSAFNNEEEIKLLCILATQLAVIAERISSYENLITERIQLRQKNFELATLNEISKNIGYSVNFHELSRTVIQSLASVIKFEVSSALIVEEGIASLIVSNAVPVSSPIIGEVKEHIVSCYDSLSRTPIDRDKLVLEVKPGTEGKKGIENLKSFFDIPIYRGEKILGIITLGAARENAFSPDDVKLLNTISREVSAAVFGLYNLIFTEKSKLKSIFDSAAEGLILLDEKSRIVLINKAARQIFEVKSENEPGTLRFLRKFRQEISGFGFQFMRWVNDALQNQTVTKDIILQKPYPMILRFILGPVIDDKGRIMGALALLRDITEEKQKEQLQAGFLSAVSHELRTPLGVIKEGVEMVLEGVSGKINPKQEKYLETVNRNINDLNVVINQLLSMADLESQSIKVKKSRQNIVRVIRKTVEIMSLKIKEKKIKLTLQVSSQPLFIRIDSIKIQQALLNLIDNAVKFTKKGGKIELKLKNKNGAVEISVRDWGRGIRLKDQEKLFRPFYELNTFLDRSERGMGLGLAIAKAYVAAHGGDILVNSKPGAGSTFTVALGVKHA